MLEDEKNILRKRGKKPRKFVSNSQVKINLLKLQSIKF
jgi:hypothetical protein